MGAGPRWTRAVTVSVWQGQAQERKIHKLAAGSVRREVTGGPENGRMASRCSRANFKAPECHTQVVATGSH